MRRGSDGSLQTIGWLGSSTIQWEDNAAWHVKAGILYSYTLVEGFGGWNTVTGTYNEQLTIGGAVAYERT